GIFVSPDGVSSRGSQAHARLCGSRCLHSRLCRAAPKLADQPLRYGQGKAPETAVSGLCSAATGALKKRCGPSKLVGGAFMRELDEEQKQSSAGAAQAK